MKKTTYRNTIFKVQISNYNEYTNSWRSFHFLQPNNIITATSLNEERRYEHKCIYCTILNCTQV